MSGRLDQISGKVKEAAGGVFDDSKLRAEGVIQQGVDKIKETAADIGEKAGDALEEGKEEAGHLVDEAKEEAESLINDIRSKFWYVLI